MDELEAKHSWKEADFDTILMYLRTVLLRRTSRPPCPYYLRLLIGPIGPSRRRIAHLHNCQ